jgi:signal transduction histidine kinase
MKIGTKELLVTSVGLAAIGALAAMIWVARADLESARDQRAMTIELVRGLSELRLLTFEYRLSPGERAKAQGDLVADRVDRLIARARFQAPAQLQILTGLRAQAAAGRRLFAELAAAADSNDADGAPNDIDRRFENQVTGKLATYQQQSMTAALLLNDLATEHAVDIQHRVMVAFLGGLVLIALIMAAASIHLRRHVLAPVAALEKATRQVTAGNLDFALGVHGDDEIADLTNNFNTMTGSLRESFAQIERSNRDLATLNAELKAFSYSVSHDLRGPLRSMDGFAMVLLEDYGDKLDEEGKDALERIRAACQRMGTLIDDLLRLSQVTRADLNLTNVNLSTMARQIADSLNEEQPGRVVEWMIEPGLNVRADPALMRIAMQNLLANAWKFTGKTELAVIRVGKLQDGEKTVIFITDNGAGFDMTHAKGLFGAFQRLHHADDFQGTGIGLAIVQRIVRRHHGDIWAEAATGAGATFFLDINEAETKSHEQDHPAG